VGRPATRDDASAATHRTTTNGRRQRLGWSYQDVLPWFKLEGQEDETSDWVGKDGLLPLTNAGMHDPNPTSRAFLEACAELGYPSTDDFNGPNMDGAGWHHINVVDGRRVSAYQAYLEPALRRPNLTFTTNAMASRLVIEDGRCTGVEYLKDGGTQTARASAARLDWCSNS
jgi:choline dehydrogenase